MSYEKVPPELIQQVADNLGVKISGGYEPPVGLVELVLAPPGAIIPRAIDEFIPLHAKHLAGLRHAESKKIKDRAARFARFLWEENPRRTINFVAARIQKYLKAEGYDLRDSTCLRYAREVHQTLGLPQRQGPRRKNKNK